MFIWVAPFKKSIDDKELIYFVPDHLKSEIKKGIIVSIPFWSMIQNAIILWVYENIDLKEINYEIKSIIEIIFPESLFFDYQIVLLKFLSENYYTLLHQSLKLFFPSNLVWKIEKQKFKLETKEIEGKTLFPEILSNEKEKSIIKNFIENKSKIKLFHHAENYKNIYLELISVYLKKWKQILILSPEIIWTNNLEIFLENKFWDKSITKINSKLSEAKKTETWKKIKLWKSKIIVWTRSSLFYPYSDLWLIIVHNEHSENHNSNDKNPRFNTFELLDFLSKNIDIKILLSSSTPLINHYYKALNKEISLLTYL